jgi:hypothetical protein
MLPSDWLAPAMAKMSRPVKHHLLGCTPLLAPFVMKKEINALNRRLRRPLH